VLPKIESSKNSLDSEEERILIAFREIKERRHGDIEISVVNGRMVKLWKVIKQDFRDAPLKEVGL
jgi:hypothetical protein